MDNTTVRAKKSVINGKYVDDFNCAICHEVYENPRYLQCNHSFCLKCIIDYIRKRLHENGLETHFYCPLCRADINISMTNIRKLINGTKTLEEDDVKHIFPRNIALASATENLNIEREFCTEHPNKIYDHFCADHGFLCCSKCILKTHRSCIRVIDIDECSQKTFEERLCDSQRHLFARYMICYQKLASLHNAKQSMLISLENLKSDVIDTITKAQDKVKQLAEREIENVKQWRGPPQKPIPFGFSCNKQTFILEIQNIASRITDCKKANTIDNLGAKLAVPIQDVRTGIKRKLDSAGLDAAMVVKRVMPVKVGIVVEDTKFNQKPF
ncbi:tripartite motif-containing protein 59-like [Mercenaria mercenaria]|uniref:tripartite motif-containing protein 59-like n=1 Tax=Mercenaria mercenaria TaxID=6596 RepID=UPI00234E9048|nr:tripartite motif-containing protein 59-like [Mercenaria mercenaria]